MTSPEPRFARVAAMIGDPTRARMLSALMSGEFITAGELARAADVSAQTASTHIAKLLDAELVVLRTQGRHRYLRIADDQVAHLLESLSFVGERSAHADKWTHGTYQPLKAARTCYRHIAGELGVALCDGFLARGTLTPCDGGYALSPDGTEAIVALGVPLPRATRVARACFDWSERRDHLAGDLAVALLDHGVARGWFLKARGSRALILTEGGARALAPWLQAARARLADPPA